MWCISAYRAQCLVLRSAQEMLWVDDCVHELVGMVGLCGWGFGVLFYGLCPRLMALCSAG